MCGRGDGHGRGEAALTDRADRRGDGAGRGGRGDGAGRGGGGVGTVLVPAATVVPLRDGPEGVEVLMVHRTLVGAFADNWVFPGGRIDPGDRGGGEDGGPGSGAWDVARRAAVREALEEAGLRLDGRALAPLSVWEPPPQAPRRFRTWFLVGVAPAGDVRVDGTEIDEAWWSPPGTVLAAHRRGDIALAPPTWITLWQLGGGEPAAGSRPGEGPPAPHLDGRTAAGTVRAGAVVRAASGRPPLRFATRIHTDGDRTAAVWDGDVAYDSGLLDVPGPRRRLWLDPAGWRLDWPDGRPIVADAVTSD